LNKRDFNEDYRIDTRTTVIFTIYIANYLVNESKVDGIFYLANEMIFRDKLI